MPGLKVRIKVTGRSKVKYVHFDLENHVFTINAIKYRLILIF